MKHVTSTTTRYASNKKLARFKHVSRKRNTKWLAYLADELFKILEEAAGASLGRSMEMPTRTSTRRRRDNHRLPSIYLHSCYPQKREERRRHYREKETQSRTNQPQATSVLGVADDYLLDSSPFPRDQWRWSSRASRGWMVSCQSFRWWRESWAREMYSSAASCLPTWRGGNQDGQSVLKADASCTIRKRRKMKTKRRRETRLVCCSYNSNHVLTLQHTRWPGFVELPKCYCNLY